MKLIEGVVSAATGMRTEGDSVHSCQQRSSYRAKLSSKFFQSYFEGSSRTFRSSLSFLRHKKAFHAMAAEDCEAAPIFTPEQQAWIEGLVERHLSSPRSNKHGLRGWWRGTYLHPGAASVDRGAGGEAPIFTPEQQEWIEGLVERMSARRGIFSEPGESSSTSFSATMAFVAATASTVASTSGG